MTQKKAEAKLENLFGKKEADSSKSKSMSSLLPKKKKTESMPEKELESISGSRGDVMNFEAFSSKAALYDKGCLTCGRSNNFVTHY